jgi:hypothetical protein
MVPLVLRGCACITGKPEGMRKLELDCIGTLDRKSANFSRSPLVGSFARSVLGNALVLTDRRNFRVVAPRKLGLLSVAATEVRGVNLWSLAKETSRLFSALHRMGATSYAPDASRIEATDTARA